MLKQEQKSEQLQKILEKFPTNVGDGLVQLQNIAFEHYKEKGEVVPFRGFFTIKEDKFVVFRADDPTIIPDEVLRDKAAMDKLLKGFKTFLGSLGFDIMGFIMIQQIWMKKVLKGENEEIDLEKSISESPNKQDCLMFLIDSSDYSFTSIYEKIVSGKDYVVSPKPIEEIYIDKKDPNSPISLEHGIFNFF